MPGWFVTSMLVLARIAAFVYILPGMSRHYVPWRHRMTLVVLLTCAVLCVLPPHPTSPETNLRLFAMLFHEAIVGASLGLVPAAMIWGLQMATSTVQGMTGLPGSDDGAANATTSPLQRLLTMVVLTVFFLSSGHRAVLEGTLESFRWLPPGTVVPLRSVSGFLIELLAASFTLGVQAISPLAMSLAMGLITLAAIHRVVPQLGYFAVGMSTQTLVMSGALFICIGGVVWIVDAGFAESSNTVRTAWQSIMERAYQQ